MVRGKGFELETPKGRLDMHPDYGLVALESPLPHRVPDAIRKPAVQVLPHLQALSVEHEPLAEERFEEIAASHRGGLYSVPSLHGDHAYDFTYTAREESCSCPDWQIRGARFPCYLVMAAAVIRAKTGVCSGCGRRFWHRELVECFEDNHNGLTYFDGDLLVTAHYYLPTCEACLYYLARRAEEEAIPADWSRVYADYLSALAKYPEPVFP